MARAGLQPGQQPRPFRALARWLGRVERGSQDVAHAAGTRAAAVHYYCSVNASVAAMVLRRCAT